MSIDKAFREMIRQEIEVHLRPLKNAVEQLQDGSSDMAALRNLAARLGPLGALLGSTGRRGPGRPPGRRGPGRPPGRRGPGRPPGSGKKALQVSGKGKRRRAPAGSNDRGCAIIGCKRSARSKGYCAAHYQKFRMLARTKRLPSDWVEHAAPNTVADIVLPRGRAAAKALKEKAS